MPPAQLQNCGRHFFVCLFHVGIRAYRFREGESHCFISLKQLFHALETTVSCAWNNCFIRLKQLEPWTLQREYPDLKWIRPYCKHTAFLLLLWSMANNKIGSINQHQWEVGFLFFLGWIRASLAIGFAFHSVTQSATQLNGKQSLRHNATHTLQADCMEPTWYLNGIRSCCANEKAAKLMVRIVDKREA